MEIETMYSDNPELFRDNDLSEAVDNAADNYHGHPLPIQFTVYEQDFAVMPASHYLCRDFAGDLIERMDETANDLVGESFDDKGLFAKFEIDSEKLTADLKVAIDAVFTKHKIQPTQMVAHGRGKEHLIRWNSQDDWQPIIGEK